MVNLLDRVLSVLPWNNYKTAVGVLVSALLVGLGHYQVIDYDLTVELLKLSGLWTALGLVHKGVKRKKGE